MFKKLSSILLAVVVVAACSKEHDSENPVITFTSPAEGASLNAADSVTISFTATDDDFHGYEYELENTTTSAIVDADDQHTHGNVSFSKKYLLPAASSFTLSVTAEDHNGNTSSKSLNFSTN